jgi:hypothetical protein
MRIYTKITAFAVVAIVLGGCYAGGPATQDPGKDGPKPSTQQQGYVPTPTAVPDQTPIPEPEPEPAPEATEAPDA